MAKLPTTIRVLNNDSDGIQIQNTFNQAIYDAMAGQLTFTENIRCLFKELTFTTDPDYSSNTWSDITFPWPVRTKPLEVVICQLWKTNDMNDVMYDPTSLFWNYVNGNIVIRWIAGLEDETTYTFRVKVI